MKPHCFACDQEEGLARATCCQRLCCPSHRYGDGSIVSGYTCSDHPFGMWYESRARARLAKPKSSVLHRVLYWAVILIVSWIVTGLLIRVVELSGKAVSRAGIS